MTLTHLKEILSTLEVETMHEKGDGWLIGHCPFAEWTHSGGADSRPAFYVKADTKKKSGFNCFGCKMSGNIASLVRTLEHFRDTKYQGLAIRSELYERESGVNAEFEREAEPEAKLEPLNEKIYANMYPKAWDESRARAYLVKRGITEQAVEVLGLLYEPDEKRIMFPIRDHKNALFGFSGRTVLKESQFPYPHFPKVRDAAELKRYGLFIGEHLVDETKPVIVVEGLFALATFISQGVDTFAHVVAAMGSNLTARQIEKLELWGRNTHLFFDRDKAGMQGMFGFENELGKMTKGVFHKLHGKVPAYRVLWPKGITDPDDLDGYTVKRMLQHAKPFVDKKTEPSKVATKRIKRGSFDG